MKTINMLMKRLVILILLAAIPSFAFASTIKYTSATSQEGVSIAFRIELDDDGTINQVLVETNAYNRAAIASTTEGTLTIPSSVVYNGQTHVVTGIGNKAFYYCNRLTSIVIPSTVTVIEGEAFRGCSGLTSIVIPENVTIINSNAFSECRNLQSITIPSSVTSLGSNLFSSCSGELRINCNLLYSSTLNGSSFSSIIIGDDVTVLGSSVFNNLKSLTSIVLGESLIEIGNNAFQGCTGLTSISIPNNVTYIGSNAFQGCTGLTSISFGDGVQDVGEKAFQQCTKLASVNINDIASWCETRFVDYYSNPLYLAKHLYLDGTEITDLTIPGSVLNIGNNVFYGYSSLTSVSIESGVSSIGTNAFNNCSNLSSVYIPNSLSTIEYNAFQNCTNLNSVFISDVASWCSIAFNNNTANPLYYANKLYLNDIELKQLIIPSDVSAIEQYAFLNCSSIESVTIPNSITTIGLDAFLGCTGLNSIYINNLSAWSVIAFNSQSSNPLYYARQLFLNDVKLTELIIPDDISSIGKNAFINCTSLTSLTIPRNITDIGDNAFTGCNGLSSVIINSNELVSTNYTYNFNFNNIFSSSVQEYVLGDHITNIGDYAFYDGDAISSVTLPISITSIGNAAFRECDGLTSINIPDGVVEIKDYAFYRCSNLTSITLPNSLRSIGINAFYNCKQLTSIAIPADVISIGQSVLANCSGLLSITMPSSISSSKLEEIFNDCTSLKTVKFRNMESFDDCLSILCSKRYPAATATFYLNDAVITDIYIPDGINTICADAFLGCTFEDIHFPESLTSIGSNAFKGSKYLNKLELPESLTSLETNVFANCIALQEVDIKGNLTTISDNSFQGCNSLTEISISEGVESIGSYAFKNCSSLDSVLLPNSMRTIGEGAFSGCSSLTNLVLNDDLLSIGKEAFMGCGITSITLTPYLTSIGESAFSKCRNLSEVIVTINEFFPISLSVFTSIKSGAILYTPYSQFDKYNTDYYWRQYFSKAIEGEPYKNNIFTLPMPNGTGTLDVTVRVTETDPYEVELITDGLTTIPSETSGSLIVPTSIVNLDGKTFYIKGIGSEFFKGTNITSITISEGVEYIKENAISQCAELSTIYLPRSIVSIENNFSGCNNLTSFYFNKRTPDEIIISDGIRDNISEQAILFVPAGTKENYVNNAIWGKCLQIYERGPISAGDITAKYGTLAELPIILNDPTTIMGLQFKLTLPKGISVAEDNGTLVTSLTDRTSSMIIMGRKDPDAVNSYLFVILSLEGNAISGDEGNIANIRLSIANDIEIKKHDIIIEDALLVSNTFSTISSECISEITIKDMTLGDVNNDNEIDIADVIGIVNYILKNPSDSFILGGADINQDGDIDIADVIGVVNLILKDSSNSMAPLRVYHSMLDPE